MREMSVVTCKAAPAKTVGGGKVKRYIKAELI